METMQIQKKDEGISCIYEVLYVPTMNNNLLNLGQLLQNGYRMLLEDNALKIFDKKNRFILKAHMLKNRTFKVEIQANQEVNCLSVTEEGESWLWHKRYNHLNFKSLNRLHDQSMVSRLPKLVSPGRECAGCCISKQPRKSYRNLIHSRTKSALEVVHSDVCGLMEVETLGGNKFFVTFTDDFTRKVWIYLLKRKSQVFEVFRKYKTMVEKQSKLSIQTLRTNGGGEFTSQDFEMFCEQEGIVHEVTPPYTPQQNGTAERLNRFVLNITRSMLKCYEVSKKLWGEVVATTTYLLNRSPSKKLDGITPEEAWTGKKPNVSHLRIFGCLCYRHVPDQRRHKLDDKGEPMILLGYHQTGAYRLFDPNTEKIVISAYVVFDEWRS